MREERARDYEDGFWIRLPQQYTTVMIHHTINDTGYYFDDLDSTRMDTIPRGQFCSIQTRAKRPSGQYDKFQHYRQMPSWASFSPSPNISTSHCSSKLSPSVTIASLGPCIRNTTASGHPHRDHPSANRLILQAISTPTSHTKPPNHNSLLPLARLVPKIPLQKPWRSPRKSIGSTARWLQ